MPVLNVGGDRLHYFDEGVGAPVIFVHGSCGGGKQWKALASALSKTYRTICPDLFGSGESEPWPVERKWMAEDDRRAIEAILALVGEPAHFIVHSAGAHFIYPILKNNAKMVRSLVLFEPVYVHLLRHSGDATFAEQVDIGRRYREAVEGGDREGAISEFVDAWSSKQGTWNGLPDPIKQFMRRGSGRLYHECMLPWFEEPSHQDLSTLNMPVLHFKGAHTIASMHRLGELLSETLPSCRFIEIEGAGHMCPFTHPEVALPYIQEHLADS